ncbi:MAG: hypothetical protein L0H93_22895 [Nocardioides sp.]|nr:hypothetical protein [Nocardioides sp.]
MTVDAAREGLDAMPSSSNFNGDSSAANYGISWYACEFIADTYGEDALWRLLDTMHDDGGTSEQGQDDVLRQLLGIDSRELARAAGKKVLATFG